MCLLTGPPPPVIRVMMKIRSAGIYLRSPPHAFIVPPQASDGPGGRARTDVHPEGYLLDRGFEILLTGYPEVR